jgi:uncharacterized protein YndB with AHSA1/START domain
VSDGIIERHDGTLTFRYRRSLAQPVATVWRAITDPETIERWSGSRPEIQLEAGGAYVSVHGEGVKASDRIVRLDPPHLFEHTFWGELQPSSLVTWELASIPTGTELRLTHRFSETDLRTGLETFLKGDTAELVIARNAAGWHRVLDRLELWLDGREDTWTPEDQKALRERYTAGLNA